MKEKILITSLAKVKAGAPWRVGIYINENYTFINVGDKGNVAMSPKFNSFLSEIEKKVSRLPVDISFHSIEKGREMEAIKVRDQIVYVDCGFELQRIIPFARFYYQKEVMGNPLEVKALTESETQNDSKMRDISENIASTALDYIAIGKVDKIVEGDIVEATLVNLSDFLKKHFEENEKITIRLNGVDTPEKYDASQTASKDPKNKTFADTYGIKLDDMYVVGDEAAKFTTKKIGWTESQKPLIVINFDRDRDGEAPIQDSGYIADVYATSEKNSDVLMKKAGKGTSFIHINKTLLTTYSEKFTHVPLGIYNFNYAANGTSLLSPIDWAAELDLQVFDPGNQTSNPILDAATDPDVEGNQTVVNSENINTDTINFGENLDPSQNNLDFFSPYDDRLAEFTKGIETVEDYKRQDKVRIGDVMLVIPPTSIGVNKTSTINKVKTLRTKSSVMVNNGHTVTTLSMDLYFHDLESINGIKHTWKKKYDKGESKKHFLVDGLRPLLAQFANAPFLPIDNYYINDVLGIHDVALMDIEVTTVPNFPESLTARITLAEFNSDAYLMDHASLGDSINYPLLRWYYNRSLVDRGEKFRYFKGLDGPIDSNITFTLADEEVLSARKNAIQFIKTADSPEVYKTDALANSSYVSKEADEVIIKEVVRQYNVYKAAKIEKYGVIDDPPTAQQNSIAKEIVETYKVKQETAENAVKAGMEIFEEMYGDLFGGGAALSNQKNIFIPYETKINYSSRFSYNILNGFLISTYDDKPPVDYDIEPYKGKREKGLIILKPFTDSDNQAKLEKNFSEYWNEKKDLWMLPGSSKVIDTLTEMLEGSGKIDEEIENYEKEFNEMLRVVESSEYGIPMKDYKITGQEDGSIIPISLNVSYSNEFSMHHVQQGTAPTLQFMGGGDPYVDLVLEVNEEAARDINELINMSDYYAKTYNQGITNGYVGINNSLTELFGIRYIMFENISVNTIEGFPGRFQVVLKAIAFNKTQRQSEELTAIPGNSTNMDATMLENNKYAFANDRLIESRLHELEVYPDLELPTYDEINSVLPDLDAGVIEEYTNLTGARYLDPDFYFSTNSTFRKLIEEEYGGSHQLNMFDGTGVAAYTSSSDADKIFNMTDEDKQKIKDLEANEDVQPLGWQFDWGGDETASEESTDSTSAGTSILDQSGTLTVLNADVLSFLTEQDDNGKALYENFPTQKEWERLFGKNSYYDIYRNKPAGSEALIYIELDKLVDKYFKKYYSNPKFIEKCKGDMKDAETYLKKVSYVTPSDLYGITYYGKKEALDLKQIKAMNKLERKDKLVKPKVPKTIGNGDWKRADKKITKERFMTLLKAFLDKMSGWNHYKGKVPALSKKGRVGLAQVDITDKDMSVDEVKRLMYNWKYNLEQSIEQLAKHYAHFAKLSDDYLNFELYARPWDAMFARYENPESKVKTSKGLLEKEFVTGILKRFEYYATKPFNTPSGYNQDVYRNFAGLSIEEDAALGNASGIDYLNYLIELEYYDKSVLKKAGLTVTSDKKKIKEAMKKHLETLSNEKLANLYQTHLKKLYDLSKDDAWAEKVYDKTLGWIPGVGGLVDEATDKLAGDRKDVNGYSYPEEVFERAAKLYEAIQDADKTAEESQGETDLRLYNDVDPHTLYLEMFHDLRHYDQRGRMARAFPGFQMFIIHEGQYFGKYKFWDNMYGFNALESIDVYKSRKIAADTAVISMSNVYSNLTTRRTDVDYVDRELKWWDNYIWNKIPQDLIDKKENEIHKNINLETGARIHLRMGYGGNAAALPVVFNGTITELEIGDLIDIVAQGDGIELGNVISGDPDDDNDGLFSVTEPRDLICSLMSSKGSWMKDYFNGVSDGTLFKDNPLGIMHFGQPFSAEDSTASKPLGNLIWFNDEYGEVAQNIYSSNGSPTYSQWLHPNGERNNIFSDLTWSNLWENKYKIFNPGDEKNVVVKFYNNTVWDVIQTITYTSPDYIAAVLPFELRSTLFFGKPYWRCAYNYGSRYEFDASNKTWVRHLVSEARRPYMQHKFYTSDYDIIQNDIKASEDGVFTNVIVNYDGKQTPVLYADADIRYDKQKTRVVEADIVGKFNDYYTSEVMATYYGCSTLRDSLKDMYKGNLLVLGDPTVKPHDMFYVGDEINDLQGNALVKAVTHHFSLDTGFVTSIEPDLLVTNDDMVILETSKWYYSFAQSVAATVAMGAVAKRAAKKLTRWATKKDGVPTKVGKWASTKAFRDSMRIADDGSKEMNAVMKSLDKLVKDGDTMDAADLNKLREKLVTQLGDAYKTFSPSTGKSALIKNTTRKALLKGGAAFAKVLSKSDDVVKVGKGITSVVRGVASFTPIGWIVNGAIWIGTEMLFEHYRRFRENLQSVVAIPLTYRGQELTAGINNHAGMIYGDAPGKLKRLTGGTFGTDDGDVEGTFGNFLFELANAITGTPGTYAESEKSAELNKLSQ